MVVEPQGGPGHGGPMDTQSGEREKPVKPARQAERVGKRDFTGGGIHMLPTRMRGSTGKPELDAMVRELAERSGCEGRAVELVAELLVTAWKVGRDGADIADLKLMNRALREMRRSNRVFQPYRKTRKVVCYGSARTPPDRPEYQAAVRFSALMVDRGFMVITGAGDGIMGAAQLGAGRDHSFGLNISLPFEQSANPVIDGDPKLVEFNYFFTRKLAFVKEGDAFALFPGGFGTMDECFELLTLIQTGKGMVEPIVMVDAPGGTYWRTFERFLREHFLRLGLISEEDLSLFRITDDVSEAVREIEQFYRVYQSYRYVGRKLVIRLQEALPDGFTEMLDNDFPDLLAEGRFETCGALPEEADEVEIAGLPRLVFVAKRNNFGRMRQLIDRINGANTVTTGA